MKRICFVGDGLLCDASLFTGPPVPIGRGHPAATAPALATAPLRDPDWIARLARIERADGVALTLFNLGIPDDTTPAIALRWRAEADPRLDSLAPEQTGLVFAFGLGDMCDDGEGGARVSLLQSVAAADRILDEASRQRPCLWIGPPAPRRLLAGMPGSWLGALNRAYRDTADRLGVPYLDLQALGDPHHHALMADPARLVADWSAWRRWLNKPPRELEGESVTPLPHPFEPTLRALG